MLKEAKRNEVYLQAYDWYRKAYEIDRFNSEIFYDWGNALYRHALSSVSSSSSHFSFFFFSF